MMDNPYEASQVHSTDTRNHTRSNPKPLELDLMLVIILDALLIGLTHVYDWLITDVWPGLQGVYVAMWLALFILGWVALAEGFTVVCHFYESPL